MNLKLVAQIFDVIHVCASLEEAYEALRTFEVLEIEKTAELSKATCKSVLETLGSSSSTPKDLFYALGVNGILKCNSREEVFEVFFSSSTICSLDIIFMVKQNVKVSELVFILF